MILNHLLDNIRHRAPGNAYVNLVADPPGKALYQSVDFRHTPPGGLAMQMMLPP